MEIKKQFNQNLEALRGFAAMSVFVYHLIINPEFNLGYEFRDGFFPYAPPGHFMVMVFFMLSGYVIGLTNKENATFSVAQYAKKRLVRLYPIYLAAIAITVLLFKENGNVILGNVFFVQNLLSDNLFYNKALWSLNHEMVYYILAIPILVFRWRSEWIVCFCMSLLAISLFLYPFSAIVEAYLVGFSFWLFGFFISKQKVDWAASPNQLLSVLILFLGCDYLNLISVLLSRIPMQHGSGMYLQGLVSVHDFALLPACLYAICTYVGVFQKLTKYLFYLVYASSLLHLAYLLQSGSFFKTQVFILPAFFVLFSLLVYYWKSLSFKIDKLAWLGSISYAVYVIHYPILYAFEKIPFFGGDLLGFVVRLTIIVPLVIFLSGFLEKKFQSWVRCKLY